LSNIEHVASFFDFVLSNLRFEDLLVEFERVLLSQVVVELAIMGFDDVALAGRRAVCEGVFRVGLEIVFHHFLVVSGAVLLADQSLRGRRMLAVIWTLAMELVDDCVQVVCISLISVLLHFSQKLLEFILDGVRHLIQNRVQSLLSLVVLFGFFSCNLRE
jgi:hypothetical protein